MPQMSKFMKKELLFFWGWSFGDNTDQKFKEAAPEDWNIHTITFEEIMPVSDPDQVSKKILSYLDKENLRKVRVFGHSVGGAIALNFAYLNPDIVEYLYISDSEGIYGPESLFNLARFVLSENPNFKTDFRGNFQAILRILKNPVLYARLAHYAHNVNLVNEANGIRVPTTIIWGEKDRLTPLEQGQKLHSSIPKSELVVLENEGHDWIVFRPEIFWEIALKD